MQASIMAVFQLLVVIFILCAIKNSVLGVNVNVLHITATKPKYVNRIVDGTVYFMNQEKHFDVNVILKRITIPDMDLCPMYNDIYPNEPPDIILDTTQNLGTEEFIGIMGMPTVKTEYSLPTEWSKIDPNGTYFVPVILPGALVPELLWEIILSKGIRNAAIFITTEIHIHESVRDRMRQAQINHVVLLYKSSLQKQLVFLKSMYFTNFFLLGRAWSARDVGKLDENCTFYSIAPNIASTYRSRVKQIGMLAYQNDRSSNPVTKYFKSLMDGFLFNVAFMTFQAARDFVNEKAWSLAYPNCSMTNFSMVRENVDLRKYLRRKVDQWIMGPLEEDGQRMYMAFNVTLSLPLENTEKSHVIATWTAGYNNGLNITNRTLYDEYSPRITYRVMVAIKPPLVYYEPKSKTPYSGYLIDLLHAIATRLNFSYEISHKPRSHSGTWNSSNVIVRELEENFADIGLGPIYISSEHERTVEFSTSYYRPFGMRFLMKRFRDNSIFTFITVLDNVVWGCILLAYFTTSLLLWLTERFSPKSYRNNKEKYKDDDDIRIFTFKECLWYCVMSLMPQGGGDVPKHLSGRLVIASWWLFGFIILASYTANLAAFLTLSKMKNPIDGFEDLQKQFNLRYAPLNESTELLFFKNMAKSETFLRETVLTSFINSEDYSKLTPWEYSLTTKYTRMWDNIKRAEPPKTFAEALSKIYASRSNTEGFAFVADAIDTRYLALTNCDLVEVGEEISVKRLGIALKKYSLLHEEFNRVLFELKAEKYLERLETKWWEDNPHLAKNCVELEDQSLGVGILNIGGVFVLLVVGIISTLCMIAFDYHMYNDRQNYAKVVQQQMSEQNKRPLQISVVPFGNREQLTKNQESDHNVKF